MCEINYNLSYCRGKSILGMFRMKTRTKTRTTTSLPTAQANCTLFLGITSCSGLTVCSVRNLLKCLSCRGRRFFASLFDEYTNIRWKKPYKTIKKHVCVEKCTWQVPYRRTFKFWNVSITSLNRPKEGM